MRHLTCFYRIRWQFSGRVTQEALKRIFIHQAVAMSHSRILGTIFILSSWAIAISPVAANPAQVEVVRNVYMHHKIPTSDFK